LLSEVASSITSSSFASSITSSFCVELILRFMFLLRSIWLIEKCCVAKTAVQFSCEFNCSVCKFCLNGSPIYPISVKTNLLMHQAGDRTGRCELTVPRYI
jgi:hypothetical protein